MFYSRNAHDENKQAYKDFISDTKVMNFITDILSKSASFKKDICLINTYEFRFRDIDEISLSSRQKSMIMALVGQQKIRGGTITINNYKSVEVDPIVGYRFRNESKDKDFIYLKAVKYYTDDKIDYELTHIKPGEEFIVSRHELYNLAILHGRHFKFRNTTGVICLYHNTYGFVRTAHIRLSVYEHDIGMLDTHLHEDGITIKLRAFDKQVFDEESNTYDNFYWVAYHRKFCYYNNNNGTTIYIPNKYIEYNNDFRRIWQTINNNVKLKNYLEQLPPEQLFELFKLKGNESKYNFKNATELYNIRYNTVPDGITDIRFISNYDPEKLKTLQDKAKLLGRRINNITDDIVVILTNTTCLIVSTKQIVVNGRGGRRRKEIHQIISTLLYMCKTTCRTLDLSGIKIVGQTLAHMFYGCHLERVILGELVDCDTEKIFYALSNSNGDGPANIEFNTDAEDLQAELDNYKQYFKV